MKLSNILMGIGGVGVILSGAGLVLDHFYPPQLDFVELPDEARQTAFSSPKRIVIADLAIDLPVEPGDIVNGKWSISPDTANYLQTSARPGSTGNIVIYGHDARKVLGPLKRARLGQTIIVYDATGQARTYSIENLEAVPPTDITPIEPTDDETLTVYTCAGIFNEQRFIVQAKPVTS